MRIIRRLASSSVHVNENRTTYRILHKFSGKSATRDVLRVCARTILIVCSREYNIESTSLHTRAEVDSLLASMRRHWQGKPAKNPSDAFPLDSYLQTIQDMHIQHTAALSQLKASDDKGTGSHHYTGNTGLPQVCLRSIRPL
jgi:hypothetical protein